MTSPRKGKPLFHLIRNVRRAIVQGMQGPSET